jgi:hypothetical protein
MKLLQEIKSELTDSNNNLSDILRKAKIIASLLKNTEVKSWVERELNGYYGVEKSLLPDYRVNRAQNYGHFSGPFGSGLRNANIPVDFLPETIKSAFQNLEFRQGIGELQSMVDSGVQQMANKWPAEIIAYMQHNVQGLYEGYHIVDAWQQISSNQIIAVLDTVRNRLLDFILELEESFPAETSDESKLSEIPRDAVTNHFHTHISGGHNIIATGNEVHQVIDKVVFRNDLTSLQNYLENLNLPTKEINILEKIIKEEDLEPSKKQLGPKVAKWISKVTEKVVTEAVVLNSKDGINALIRAIKTYYGLE